MRKTLVLLVGLMFAVQVFAEETGDTSGLGGTGRAPSVDGNGIGGTGRAPEPAPKPERGDGGESGGDGGSGGIGGTGMMAGNAGEDAGVAVFGTVTAFGSIWVNGLEIEYDAQTPVTMEGAPVAADALQLGQVVMVDTLADAGGGHWARGIQIVHELCGPIGEAPMEGVFDVLGRGIHVRPDAVIAGGVDAVEDLRKGETVRVSGFLRKDGGVDATRIDVVSADVVAFREPPVRPVLDAHMQRFVMEGIIFEVDAQGPRNVGGFALDLTKSTVIDETRGESCEPNHRVRVYGLRGDDGRLRAERIEGLEGVDGLRGGAKREHRREVDGGVGDGDVELDTPERGERPEHGERVERAERAERSEGSERIERPEREDRSGRSERVERPEREDRGERSDREDRSGRQ